MERKNTNACTYTEHNYIHVEIFLKKEHHQQLSFKPYLNE